MTLSLSNNTFSNFKFKNGIDSSFQFKADMPSRIYSMKRTFYFTGRFLFYYKNSRKFDLHRSNNKETFIELFS